jgi:histidinol-phosphate aminotransferase
MAISQEPKDLLRQDPAHTGERPLPRKESSTESSSGFLREVLHGTLLTAAAFGCGCGRSEPPVFNPGGGPLVPPQDSIRLAFNESPFGPPPGAFLSMQNMLARPYAMHSDNPDLLPGINRYPGFLDTTLTTLIAERHQIAMKYVVPCCGISELIYMCSQAFLGEDRHLVTPQVSYTLPAHYALRKGSDVRTAPMGSDHGIDLAALLERVDSQTGLVYLANPNNPTGSLLSLDRLASFVRKVASVSPETVVLVDEAYMDYVRETPLPEAVELIYQYPVVVGRTFSKAFGMAGLRGGYLVGHEETVLTLNGFLSGYLGGLPGWRQFEGDVNRMAVAALEGCLNQEGYSFVAGVRDRTIELREHLFQGLEGFGYSPLPGHGNFLLVHGASPGENLRGYLCTRKILVQAGEPFDPAYRDWIRVSVGSREEIDIFLDALKGFDPSRAYPACIPVFHHGI